MKRFLHRNEDENAEINLTPMLDVIFIMLIFFIVTTSFVKESGVSIDRPSAKTTKTKTDANIVLAIKDNNEVWIDKKMVDLYFVTSTIEQLKSQSVKNSVVIQADKRTKTGFLVKVMDRIRQAGISNISVATIKE